MGCKPNVVSRTTHSRFQVFGKQRARANWRKKARKRYGWRYRKWSKAEGRDYQVDIRGQDFLLYKIRAFGRPCK
ncbi:hypothetical protein [Nocardiopsis sp. CC223A]|uniref:hypothetical protein n=1 Tax=Nocardiopsis sp. CC223A TaxID=3044051 RepID=UPI00278C3C7A|nr:hypothetical protein [Nocardiopsis sp. CC223A]